MNEVNESDWKLFRSRIAGWQEDFISKLNAEYVAILTDKTKCEAARFWEIEKRIKADCNYTGVICEMRRSILFTNMCALYREGAIHDEDLEGFSDELVRHVKAAGSRKQS